MMLYLLAVFAVWRVSYMLHQEDGPKDIFKRLRAFFITYTDYKSAIAGVAGWTEYRPKNWIGEMLMCFYCTSVWVAILPAVYLGWGSIPEILIWWLGLSGLAIFLELLRRRLDE